MKVLDGDFTARLGNGTPHAIGIIAVLVIEIFKKHGEQNSVYSAMNHALHSPRKLLKKQALFKQLW